MAQSCVHEYTLWLSLWVTPAAHVCTSTRTCYYDVLTKCFCLWSKTSSVPVWVEKDMTMSAAICNNLMITYGCLFHSLIWCHSVQCDSYMHTKLSVRRVVRHSLSLSSEMLSCQSKSSHVPTRIFQVLSQTNFFEFLISFIRTHINSSVFWRHCLSVIVFFLLHFCPTKSCILCEFFIYQTTQIII